MDFDTILNEVGSFGIYQKVVICFVLLPAALPCAFHAYSQLFIAATPKHWCRVPELDPWTDDYMPLVKNLTIPLILKNGEYQYSECEMYKRNYTEIVRYLEHRAPMDLVFGRVKSIEDPSGAPIVKCTHGWRYDKSMYPVTVASEWNLVCDRDFYITMALVLFGVAGLIGNYIFGYLQDIWGRRPSFYFYLIVEIVACASSAFTWNFFFWLSLRFVVGLTVPAVLASPYVLAIELVGPDRRVFCTIASNIAYSIGLVLLAAIVYVVRDWRLLSLAVSLPLLFLFSCLSILPESPRWLIAVGQYRRAAKILKTIGRVNGKTMPKDYVIRLQKHLARNETFTSYFDSERTYGITDLFKTPNLRAKTLIITFIWFANTSVYVGLSYYAPSLGGDEIWNFFLAGAVELPTYLVLWPAMQYFGRRWVLCLSMIIGGTACIMTFMFQDDANVMLILYCIGKMGISSGFVVLPLLASELYPTVVRGLGMSFSSVIAMIGPILIPLINHTGEHWLVLPLIIMGVLLTLGGLASLWLPETRGQNLPQTLEEGEAVPILNMVKCFYKRNVENEKSEVPKGTKVVCSLCQNDIKNLRQK